LRAYCGDPRRGSGDNRDEISSLLFSSLLFSSLLFSSLLFSSLLFSSFDHFVGNRNAGTRWKNDAIIFDTGREVQNVHRARSRHLRKTEVFASIIALSV
jgi:membrane protein involved in colicin uptake